MTTSEQPQRITWTRSRYGVLRGEIGGIEIANIGESTTRGDTTQHLRTTLPGFTGDRTADSEAEAQAMAERILKRFVHLLGADFTKVQS